MASTFAQLASAPFANLVVLAALVCIAMAIFGWAQETIAATGNFRATSGMIGVLLLFFVYGIYLPHAAHNAGSNDPQGRRPTATRSTPAQQVIARRTQSAAPQAVQSAQSAKLAAQSSPSSTQEPATQIAKSTTPPPPTDGRNGTPEQEQSSQPSTPQAPAQNLFSGRWKNADPKAASIRFLRVEEQGDEITVRAWGSCLPQHAGGGRAGDPVSQYCDWGTGHGTVRDGAASVTWKEGTVLRRMKLEPEGGSLRVVLDSTSRGRPQHVEAHFAKGL